MLPCIAYLLATLNPTRSHFVQLWMQNGKQNRIPMEPKFDGRGIPSETHYQLGCDTMGKTTVRAVGDTVRTGSFRLMRITSSHIHRLQGNIVCIQYISLIIVFINSSHVLYIYDG